MVETTTHRAGLTVEVEPLAPGAGTPSGTVRFVIGKKTLGTAAIGAGQATLSFKPASILNRPITVTYGGDADFLPAQLAAPRFTSRSLASLARHGA